MKKRFLDWAYRGSVVVGVVGGAGAVLALYASDDANRFWAVSGTWLAFLALVLTPWIGHRRTLAEKPRRLSVVQTEKLKQLFTTEPFQDRANLVLQVAAVKDDPEAKTFAIEIQDLLKSCGVNVYPSSDWGEPNEAKQTGKCPYGLGLQICVAAADAPAFQDLHRCLTEIGLPTLFGVDKDLPSKRHRGILTVLNRPER